MPAKGKRRASTSNTTVIDLTNTIATSSKAKLEEMRLFREAMTRRREDDGRSQEYHDSQARLARAQANALEIKNARDRTNLLRDQMAFARELGMTLQELLDLMGGGSDDGVGERGGGRAEVMEGGGGNPYHRYASVLS